MRRTRRLPVARCPDPLHRESYVTANGTRQRAGRTIRDYRCTPALGNAHTFSVTVEDGRPVRWHSPVICPLHPVSRKVVRNGSYGRTKRQRYRCQPLDGKAHSFTPKLPREHVYVDPIRGTRCVRCGEPRSVHNGATAAARRHGFSTEAVARGLAELAGGDAYTEVSLKALRTRPDYDEIGPRRRVAKAKPSVAGEGAEQKPETDDAAPPSRKKKRISATGVERRRAWRIAANWVDAFAPVIWQPLDERLRARGLAERARLDRLIAEGKPLTRPQIILVDDKPVLAKDGNTKRRDGGFYLLVVAEVLWEPIVETRLRLIRAFPRSNTAAWRLVFDELGYDPDFVVADAGRGIRAAFDVHFAGKHTQFVPSLWHVAHSIRRALGIEARKSFNAAVEAQLVELGRNGAAWHSAADWAAWWDGLGAIVKAEGLPYDAFLSQRAGYDEALLQILPHLLTYPDLPIATGGLETILKRTVDHALEMRTQFANIERTNSLFDLVVAREHHVFDHEAEIVRALREDAEEHDGWTVALRGTDDPQPAGLYTPDNKGPRYSSLRDPTLLADLARSRGLL